MINQPTTSGSDALRLGIGGSSVGDRMGDLLKVFRVSAHFAQAGDSQQDQETDQGEKQQMRTGRTIRGSGMSDRPVRPACHLIVSQHHAHTRRTALPWFLFIDLIKLHARQLIGLICFATILVSPGCGAKSVSTSDKSSAPDHTVHTLTWSEVKDAPYDEGRISPGILTQDGLTMRITGYMLPGATVGDQYMFMLVQNAFGCCYGQPPQINHMIEVTAHLDHQFPDYVGHSLQVTGVFHVGEEKSGDIVTSVYRLSDASVEIVEEAPQQ